uniref:Neurobeachin-like n=1 Tax=Saccoglossus kowalevskii TaxID=10224 RepID=A0ABM0LWJ1_SACKO|nr:PREDICTED: neurobeachin-like [Saccoglossus kowalevskii]
MFIAIIRKSVRNLQACTEVGLIEYTLKRLKDDHDIISDLLIDMLGVLASYSITVKELKLFFSCLKGDQGKWPRHASKLLLILRQMPLRRGSDAFFSFPGKNGAAVALPPVAKWPYQSGFTFSTWFRLDPINSINIDRVKPYLYCFRTGKGVGYSAHFMGSCLVVTAMKSKNKGFQHCIKYDFQPRKWYMVTIVHIYSRWRNSEIRCYVNGKLVSYADMAWFVNTSDPYDKCFLGSAPTADMERVFCGQMAAVYLFNDALASHQIEAMCMLGPNYKSLFKFDSESDLLLSDQCKRILYDGKLSNSIVFTYNPIATDSQLCLESSPKGNPSIFVHSPHALMLKDVKAIVTHSIHSTLHSIGGIQVLFPLFTQLDYKQQYKDEEGEVDYTICSTLLALLCDLIESSVTTQQQMIQVKGFLISGYLLQKASTNHITEAVLESLLSLAKYLNRLPTGITLLKNMVDHIMFNPSLWIHTPARVQMALYTYLATEFISQTNIFSNIRRVSTVLQLMHALKYYYWIVNPEDRSGISPKGLDGIRPSRDELKQLRALLLLMVKQLVLKDRNTNDEELQSLLNYLVTVHEDDNLKDVMQLMLSLMAEHGNTVVPAFDKKNGIRVFFKLLASKDEIIRVMAMKTMAFFLGKMPHKRKLDLMYSHSLYSLLGERLSLNSNCLSPLCYTGLFEILTERVTTQIIQGRHPEPDKTYRVMNPGLFQIIAKLIRQSAPSEKAIEVRKMFLSDMILLFNHSRENRRILLQCSVWQDWMLGLAYIYPKNDDERKVTEMVYSLLRMLLHHAMKFEWGGWRVWVDTLSIIHSKVSFEDHKSQLARIYEQYQKQHNSRVVNVSTTVSGAVDAHIGDQLSDDVSVSTLALMAGGSADMKMSEGGEVARPRPSHPEINTREKEVKEFLDSVIDQVVERVNALQGDAISPTVIKDREAEEDREKKVGEVVGEQHIKDGIEAMNDQCIGTGDFDEAQVERTSNNDANTTNLTSVDASHERNDASVIAESSQKNKPKDEQVDSMEKEADLGDETKVIETKLVGEEKQLAEEADSSAAEPSLSSHSDTVGKKTDKVEEDKAGDNAGDKSETSAKADKKVDAASSHVSLEGNKLDDERNAAEASAISSEDNVTIPVVEEHTEVPEASEDNTAKVTTLEEHSKISEAVCNQDNSHVSMVEEHSKAPDNITAEIPVLEEHDEMSETAVNAEGNVTTKVSILEEHSEASLESMDTGSQETTPTKSMSTSQSESVTEVSSPSGSSAASQSSSAPESATASQSSSTSQTPSQAASLSPTSSLSPTGSQSPSSSLSVRSSQGTQTANSYLQRTYFQTGARPRSGSHPAQNFSPGPHRVPYRIPEFFWSHMHQRMMSDLLFAIETDIQVWRSQNTKTVIDCVNSSENIVFVQNVTQMISQISDNLIYSCGGILPLLSSATSRTVSKNDPDVIEPTQGMPLEVGISFIHRIMNLVDVLVFASNQNFAELEAEKNMSQGGILRQCLRLACCCAIRNCLECRYRNRPRPRLGSVPQQLPSAVPETKQSSRQRIQSLIEGTQPSAKNIVENLVTQTPPVKEPEKLLQDMDINRLRAVVYRDVEESKQAQFLALAVVYFVSVLMVGRYRDILETESDSHAADEATRQRARSMINSPTSTEGRFQFNSNDDMERVHHGQQGGNQVAQNSSEKPAVEQQSSTAVVTTGLTTVNDTGLQQQPAETTPDMNAAVIGVSDSKKADLQASAALAAATIQTGDAADVETVNVTASSPAVISASNNGEPISTLSGVTDRTVVATADAASATYPLSPTLPPSEPVTPNDAAGPTASISSVVDASAVAKKPMQTWPWTPAIEEEKKKAAAAMNKKAMRNGNGQPTMGLPPGPPPASALWNGNTTVSGPSLAEAHSLLADNQAMCWGGGNVDERLQRSLETTAPLLREIFVDFAQFLSKTLVGSHGQELLIEGLVSMKSSNSVIELVMLLCSQEWQNSIQKHAGLAFIELINEGRLHSHATREHILRVSNEAEFILSRQRAEDVMKHAEFESLCATSSVERKDEERLCDHLITAARHRDHMTANQVLQKILGILINKHGAWMNVERTKEFFKLDSWEDNNRRRRRLVRNPYGSTHPSATLKAALEHGAGEDAIEKAKQAIHAHLLASSNPDDQQDLENDDINSQLEDLDLDAELTGPLVYSTQCSLIGPAVMARGTLSITSAELYFEVDEEDPDFKKIDPKVLSYTDGLHGKWGFHEIRAIFSRRYLLQNTALEIFMANRSAMMFNFPDTATVKKIVRSLPRVGVGLKYGISPARRMSLATPKQLFRASNMTQRWQRREITNFEYLMYLNTIAGRTYNDLNQYPVFPWVLTNYDSNELDLTLPSNFRDLSKPIGALNPSRRAFFQERFESWDDDKIPPFHYGTHYSTAGFTLAWLIRLEPFTTYFLNLQGGKFDHASRTFSSLAESWKNCQRDTSDVKELIPEFYYLPEMFINSSEYTFGVRDDGKVVDNVQLPPWAKSPEEFVRINRMALESEFVSCQLHQWVDLVYGYKQRGPESVRATNVYYYLTYEGNVNLDHITDPVTREVCISTIIVVKKKVSVSWIGSWHCGTPKYFLLGTPGSPGYSMEATKNLLVEMDPLILSNTGLHRRQLNDTLASNIKMKSSSFIVSSDNKFIMACGYWDKSFRVFYTDTAKVVQVVFGHWDVVTCLARSETPVGSDFYVVSGSRDATLLVWYWSSKLQCIVGDNTMSGEMATPRAILTGHDTEIVCVAVCAELGLVVSGSQGGPCLVHTVHGDLLRTLESPTHCKSPKIVAVSTDGPILIVYNKGHVCSFSINGKFIKDMQINDNLQTIRCTPDGEYFLTAGDNKVIEVWRTFDFKHLYTFPYCDHSILHLSLSHDMRTMIAGLSSGSIVIFNINFQKWHHEYRDAY